VIPQKSLGGQHIPDFLIGQLSSDGFGWILVELESPTALMFRKDGDPSAALVHALRQITDWRAWLERNRDFATRARTDAGLGLTDISPNSHGLIIGRERDLNPADQPRRWRLAYDNRIEIRSYDYLLRLVRRQSPSMAEAAEVLDWFKPQG
jgi:hypothetical protein